MKVKLKLNGDAPRLFLPFGESDDAILTTCMREP